MFPICSNETLTEIVFLSSLARAVPNLIIMSSELLLSFQLVLWEEDMSFLWPLQC